MTLPESTLAAAVAGWLEGKGYEVYEEVGLSHEERRHAAGMTIGYGRADLVGRSSDALIVVECKKTLSFEVFAQARRWRPFANGVYIAVFAGEKFTDARREAIHVARDYYRVGVLELGHHGLNERCAPTSRAIEDDALLTSIRDGHRYTGLAGTNRGGQFTTYKETGAKLASFVAANPGCKLDEAVPQIEHHYASDQTAIVVLLRIAKRGEIPGVHVGWKQRLWPTAEQAMGVRTRAAG